MILISQLVAMPAEKKKDEVRERGAREREREKNPYQIVGCVIANLWRNDWDNIISIAYAYVLFFHFTNEMCLS